MPDDKFTERYVATMHDRVAQLTAQRAELVTSLKAILNATDKCTFGPCPENFALMRTLEHARALIRAAE